MRRLPGPEATWILGFAFLPLAGECAALAVGGQSGRILWVDLWIAAGLFLLLSRRGYALDIPRAPFLIALAPLVAWAALTLPFALDPLTSLAEMKEWIVAAAAGALALRWARDGHRARSLLGAVALAGAVTAVLMAASAVRHPLGPAAAVLLKQVDLPIGRSNYLAGLLALSLPIATGLFAASKGAGFRLRWFAVTAAIALGLALSGSKGAVLAATLGCAVAFFAPGAGRLPRAPRVLLISAAALFVLAFAAGPLRVALDYRLQASALEYSGGEREALYRKALEVAAQRPVFGAGLNGFSVAAHGIHGVDTVPHNFELGFLAELGVPGLFLALFWAWSVLAPARGAAAAASHPRSRALARGAWGALLGAFVHNQVESTLYGEHFKILFILVGAAALQLARPSTACLPLVSLIHSSGRQTATGRAPLAPGNGSTAE